MKKLIVGLLLVLAAGACADSGRVTEPPAGPSLECGGYLGGGGGRTDTTGICIQSATPPAPTDSL